MARVNIDQAKKVLTAHKLAGPHIRRTSNRIIQGARALAPRGDHLSGSGVRKPGQTLAQSLKIDAHSTVYTIVEAIGSSKVYAMSEHQGSSGHYIRGSGKRLKFEWERGNLLISARASGRLRGRGPSRRLRKVGPYFLFKAVHHPGNKRPVRFLTTPLYMYGRLNGFRVTTTAGASRSRLP
jgi:hypothetical protein